jgi:hypothetical protein
MRQLRVFVEAKEREEQRIFSSKLRQFTSSPNPLHTMQLKRTDPIPIGRINDIDLCKYFVTSVINSSRGNWKSPRGNHSSPAARYLV